MMMADAYILKKDYGQAEKILKAVSNQLPQFVPAHEGLGAVDVLSNDFSGAQRQFEQAWSLRPNSEAILSQVVQTYVQQKEFAGATKFPRRAADKRRVRIKIFLIISWLESTLCRDATRRRISGLEQGSGGQPGSGGDFCVSRGRLHTRWQTK